MRSVAQKERDLLSRYWRLCLRLPGIIVRLGVNGAGAIRPVQCLRADMPFLVKVKDRGST